MSTIFDELRLDHDAHQRLLAELAETTGDSTRRRELFRRVRDELQAHARAEERVLYARMLADPSSQARASHSVHEHEEQNERLEALSQMERSSPAWLPALRELAECVAHHEDEEERSVFPVAGKLLSSTEKERLADEFRAEKRVEAGE